MKLIPVITEKGLKDAKNGRYTFLVNPGFRKPEIRKEIEIIFGVHVTGIQTAMTGVEVKRNNKGIKRNILPQKKVRVTLKDKETIDLFEEKSGKNKK